MLKRDRAGFSKVKKDRAGIPVFERIEPEILC